MTTRPIRLGLPWQLHHYKPLNGPHPLVLSFLEGNHAVEPVGIAPVAAAVPRDTQTRVLARMARLTHQVPDEVIPKFLDWLSLPDQVAIESRTADFDAIFLHDTTSTVSNCIVRDMPMASYVFAENGAFTVTLQDGQVWEQLPEDEVYHPARWRKEASEYEVTITPAAMRTFTMTVDGYMHKVRRIH